MKKIIAFLPILSLLIFSSCDKESDCQEQQILPITSLEEKYGCNDTRFEVDVDLSEDYTIIRSQSEYDSLVTSTTCNPQIDFSTYDLLIGKRLLGQGNSSVDYVLRRPCSSDTLMLSVIFDQDVNDPIVVSNTTYHALIPKLRDNEAVDVKFTMQY